jgi:hypothetical protein
VVGHPREDNRFWPRPVSHSILKTLLRSVVMYEKQDVRRRPQGERMVKPSRSDRGAARSHAQAQPSMASGVDGAGACASTQRAKPLT